MIYNNSNPLREIETESKRHAKSRRRAAQI